MSYALAIFDLDGTLFRGEEPIPGAVEAVARCRASGTRVRYLTNNSSQTRDTFTAKLRRLGFEAHDEEVYSSAIGTAAFLRDSGLKTAFVVGERGLSETLNSAGIATESSAYESVVAGICKTFSYDLLNSSMQHIRSGAKFVATNTDPTYPMEEGKFIPGAGSIVAAIQTCAEAAPFVVGKPNPYLINLILRDAGVQAAECLVIGDRLDTDIEAGSRAGSDTMLVLTGATLSPPSGQRWLPSVADLIF